MGYELIFLDADGTLFDYDAAEAEALASALAPLLGLPLDAATLGLYRDINRAVWRELERGRITQAELAVERFRRLFHAIGRGGGDPAAVSLRYLDELGRRSRLLPGAEETVRALAASHRLVLVTNGLARVQRPRIERSAIASFFGAVVISDEVGVAKPDPAILDLACALLGVGTGPGERRGMLFVGDSPAADVAVGKAFGIDTCWYNPGARPLAPGEPAATHVIATLGELPAIAG